MHYLLDGAKVLTDSFEHCLQVKIQKDSEVRLKIIGTRVDATEIVCPAISFLSQNQLACFLKFFTFFEQ